MGKRLTLVLAAVVVVVLPLSAYIGCYFWLGSFDGQGTDFSNPEPDDFMQRVYQTKLEAAIFTPAGKIEGGIRGVEVVIFSAEWADEQDRERFEEQHRRIFGELP